MNFPKKPSGVGYVERHSREVDCTFEIPLPKKHLRSAAQIEIEMYLQDSNFGRLVLDEEEDDQPHQGNILTSKRPLNADDVKIVSFNLGKSWRILGHRLNFSVETLNEIESFHHSMSATFSEKAASHMLRIWSQLPSANVGRLAFVLWEMGKHEVALQLVP